MCQACLVNRQLQWKFRLSKEVNYSDITFWLTLQYDDEHLPRSNGVPCVDKNDCQNFFRKLRKYIDIHELKLSFKYFLVSEYGPTTNRPHYHCLMLFRADPCVTFNQKLKYRQMLYNVIYERWYHGHVEEKPFHNGVIRYLTKYVFKPQSDFDPPVRNFRLISKGIGEDYLLEIDRRQIQRDNWRSPHGMVPRYYRDKIYPLTPGVFDYNRKVRNDIFNRQLDFIYKNSLDELRSAGSIENYNCKKDYELKSQRSLCEHKQKQKYG